MKKLNALTLMILVTILVSIGQMLWKLGAENLTISIQGTLLNLPLITGLIIYGLGLLVLMVALKKGDVSSLYPIMALSYVWVSAISYFYFEETFNTMKILGVIVIIVGVAILAKTNPYAGEVA